MRILVDENLPAAFFTHLLLEYETRTIGDLGWNGIKNGELMERIEGNFDVFVTADKNIKHQQRLSHRAFAILEIPTNRLPLLKTIQEEILSGIRGIQGNEYKQIRM